MILAPEDDPLLVEDHLVDTLGKERLARVPFHKVRHLWVPAQ